jgi:hypothetical protein
VTRKLEVVKKGARGFIGETTIFRRGTDQHIMCVSYKSEGARSGRSRTETLAYESDEKGNPVNGIILASVEAYEDHGKFIQRVP